VNDPASRIFISVGSSIDPAESVRKAIGLLRAHVRVLAISTFYRTQALERPGDPDFFNGVVEIATAIPPLELKRSILRGIEEELGRKRTGDKFAPRTIDLDVIIYGRTVTSGPGLVLPDPEITRRPFLAVPLFEIAPDLVIPGSGVPLKEAVAGLAGHGMEPLIEYTERLRRELLDEP
jgi:2-amino-4-hydroxy-6-hydroxymethyldihydropteridine diphosphokinase